MAGKPAEARRVSSEQDFSQPVAGANAGMLRFRGGPSCRREEKPVAAILPMYLREVGATSLLGEQKDLELARDLQEAWEALARIGLRQPRTCREYTLEGDLEGPRLGRQWPLDRLERFYSRLLRYAREHADPRLQASVDEAKRFKLRLDRAREGLVLANLRLVIYLAKKYLRHGVSFMDLIQEGNIGLMKAVEKFEVERGTKFCTYAFWWIKQGIQRAIADKARLIRIPVHVSEKMKKIFRAAEEMGESAGPRHEPQQIASALGMPVENVESILRIAREPQAFEEFTAGEGKGLLEFLPDPDAPSPIQAMLDRERQEKVDRTLKALTPREEKILRMRFGIGRETPSTLEEVGQTLGLSRERVRQIEASALRNIRFELQELSGRPARQGPEDTPGASCASFLVPGRHRRTRKRGENHPRQAPFSPADLVAIPLALGDRRRGPAAKGGRHRDIVLNKSNPLVVKAG